MGGRSTYTTLVNATNSDRTKSGRRKAKDPKSVIKQGGRLLGEKFPEQQGFLQPEEGLGKTQEVEIMRRVKIEVP